MFKGAPCLMTTVASQLTFNLDLRAVDLYKSIVSRPVTFASSDQENGALKISRLADVYSDLQEGVSLGTMYNVDVAIVDVDMSTGWKYVHCNTCRKKTTLINNRYFCDACRKSVMNPRQVYKLVVRVIDQEEDAVFVLFNDAALAILGLTVDDLMLKSLSEGAGDPNWIHEFLIESLYGTNAVFRIKIDAFNVPPKCERRFTVSKYLGREIIAVQQQTTTTTIVEGQVIPSNGACNGQHETENVAYAISPLKKLKPTSPLSASQVIPTEPTEYASYEAPTEVLSRFTSAQVEMIDEISCRSHQSSVTHTTAMSSVVLAADQEVDSYNTIVQEDIPPNGSADKLQHDAVAPTVAQTSAPTNLDTLHEDAVVCFDTVPPHDTEAAVTQISTTTNSDTLPHDLTDQKGKPKRRLNKPKKYRT
ncbi:hypothetical protein L1987_76606 [Smallanthus sonchifolius]|uniref:Uncharacterized protein n=1 Tax=Smallanthus sonchifolius TaxID=185202 RepID=A0ACB8Z7S7_9ASTR|nr:hypothetical protein L1987_76606 [Smallanthus sonchifolius]